MELDKADEIAQAFKITQEEQHGYARQVLGVFEQDPRMEQFAREIREHYQL